MRNFYLSKVNIRWIALVLFLLIKLNASAQIFATTQSNGKNITCLSCTITNPGYSVDSDLNNNYSLLNLTVAVLGAEIHQKLTFPMGGVAGDFVAVVIEAPNSGLLDISLLGNMSLTTYNGGTSNNDTKGSGGIYLGLLAGSSSKYVVQFKSTYNFDAVEFKINAGIASTMSSLRVYYAAYSQMPLPVTFSYFNAATNDDYVQLNWGFESIDETGINTIEKSSDGINYAIVASLSSNNQKTFEYLDEQTNSGLQYYRIQFKGANEKIITSKIACVTITKTKDSFSFYPNPINDAIIIDGNQNNEAINVLISTMDGRVIFNDFYSSYSKITINNLGNLEKGIYRIEIKSADKYSNSILIKN